MTKTKLNKLRSARSLVTVLAFAFFSLSVVILLAYGGFALYTNIQTSQVAISSKQQLIAQAAAKTVSVFINNKFRDMEIVVRLSRPVTSGAETQKTILQSLLGEDQAFRQFALLDSRGRRLAEISRYSDTLSSQFIAQLSGDPLIQTSKGQENISPVYIDDNSSEPLIAIAVPSKDVFGDFQGTLVAEVNLKFMWELVDQLKVGQTGYVYVVDNQGNLIAFGDKSRVLRGENVQQIAEVQEFIQNQSILTDPTTDVADYTGLLGTTVVGTYVSLGSPEWAVVVELPWDEAYQPVIQATTASILAILVMAVLAGFIGVYVARRLAVPLVNLTETATRIAGGEMGLQTTVSGPQEVVSLAMAFNSMTAQVHDLLGSLEQRVTDRTAELSHANKRLEVELTERKRAEDQLVYTALHDPLTNLANRVLFMDRLKHAMERAKRHKNYEFAVLFLDLDRFKVVNDSLGHKIGDLLLIESTRRLAGCLRSEDTLARLGGDEFVILLEYVQDPMDAKRIADRIQYDMAVPCDLEGHKVFISVSMGIVMGAARYERPDDILRDADIAMYRAKGQGRGRYEMFDMAMLASVMTRVELETDLRKALERQEFVIHYQPIVMLGIRRIVGFEALVRWQHPTRGLVSPGDFIPMAEETGLIVPIGYWVLTQACQQIREWQVQFPANPPLTVSVNLSVRQCAETNLVQKVGSVLQKTGLDASSLKLELTESMIVEDTEAISVILSELRTLGVQVQMDDFGTGYSSLGSLQKLPINALKIDRTFVSRIGNDSSGSDIVRTIMALAHDLGMKVVAEGIETDEQLSELKSMGCEYGQGFLFTRPIDSRAASKLLAEPFATIEG